MSTPRRSASLPLACSMMTRLFSAACSCSLRVSLCRMPRSCSKLMVATSASAWPTRMSAGARAPGPARNRFSAPMTCSRSRIGSACTAANPARRAAGANRGQRSAAAARSAAWTGRPDRKQSWHGPWWFWSWNSSSSRTASLEAATTRSSPRGSASSSPAAETSSSCTLRSVSTCRKSITSKPATMVSVSSTNVSDSSCPSIPVHPLSLLFNLSVCGFFLGSGWPGGFPHVMAGGRAAVPGTGRAPGSWFAGFRCRCEGGQCAVDVPESLADPGGGQAAGRGGALPGQAEVFGDAAGEPELGQGGQDQPGPPVGGGGVAEPGAGPAEDLLEEPECVFDIETPQERLPAAVYPGGIRGGIGGPQPHRPGVMVVRQVIDGELDKGALDDRQLALVACPGAAGLQPGVHAVPGAGGGSAVPAGLAGGGHVRAGAGGLVSELELAAMPQRGAHLAGLAGWRRLAQHPVRAKPPEHLHRQVAQQPGQPGRLVP